MRFFRAVRSGDEVKAEKARQRMTALLLEALDKISRSERCYGVVMSP